MKKNALIALVALVVGLAPSLRGQNGNLAPVTRTFALTNVNIVQSPGEVIEMGTIVVKDGLIHAVGKNVKIPGNAKVLDADSMFVYAGFIEALSRTGIPRPEAENAQGSRRFRPEGVIPGQPTNEQAGITPELKASSVLSAKEKSIGEMRQLGFTTAHIVPEGRMLPGQGAVILLNGEGANDMILRDQISLFSQLAPARGVYPSTAIGVMSKWRELYKQAQQAQTHETLYKLDPKGMPRPEYDPALRAFYPVLDGQLPVFFVASAVKDIHRVLMLKQELAFPLVLAEVKEGWHAADQIKSMNIPVLLSLDLPEEPKKEDKKKEGEQKEETSKAKTPAEIEKEELEKRRAEFMDQYLKQAALMAGKGVTFGFSTLDVKSKDIKSNLNRMIKNGLTADQALAALTTVPAKMLGLSNMMGTVETGKIANLVVSTGPYFEEASNVRYVFVDGTPYEYEVKKKKTANGEPAVAANPVGAWSYNVEVPGQEAAGTITITQEGSNYAGQMTSNQGGPALTLSNIVLDGNTMTFNVSMDAGGQSMSLSFEVVISGDNFEGSVSVGSFGTFDVEGERLPGPKNR